MLAIRHTPEISILLNTISTVFYHETLVGQHSVMYHSVIQQ